MPEALRMYVFCVLNRPLTLKSFLQLASVVVGLEYVQARLCAGRIILCSFFICPGGAFSAWSPSDVACVPGQFQSRSRENCPEVMEIRSCKHESKECNKLWTPWTVCDTNNLQERYNSACGPVEVRECQMSEEEVKKCEFCYFANLGSCAFAV